MISTGECKLYWRSFSFQFENFVESHVYVNIVPLKSNFTM